MDKKLSNILIVLVSLGLLVSIYMTIYKYSGNDSMCIGSGGCHQVTNSRYAVVNGIPVPVIGVGGYGALVAVLFLERRREFFKQNGVMVFFGLALTGFLFTVYLIYVEIAMIKALCPFCVTSQVVMTLIFILSVVRLIQQPQQ